MATEKQIAANRANAQKSTGPRTEDGKAASSRNNLRHGLTARGFIILEGQEDAFAQLEVDLRDRLIPEGPLQEVIFKRALESAWNLERCRQAAVQLHSCLGSPTVDPLLDLKEVDRYGMIHKYAREAENSLYKAMRELGKLQSELQYRSEKVAVAPAQQQSSELVVAAPSPLSEVCSTTQAGNSLKRQFQTEAKIKAVKVNPEVKPGNVRRYETDSDQRPPQPTDIEGAEPKQRIGRTLAVAA